MNPAGFLGRTRCKACGLRKDKRRTQTPQPENSTPLNTITHPINPIEEVPPPPPKVEERAPTLDEVLMAILQNQQQVYEKIIMIEHDLKTQKSVVRVEKNKKRHYHKKTKGEDA